MRSSFIYWLIIKLFGVKEIKLQLKYQYNTEQTKWDPSLKYNVQYVDCIMDGRWLGRYYNVCYFVNF